MRFAACIGVAACIGLSCAFDNPGVSTFTFLFAADPSVDGKFDTPYVDSVVATVQSSPAVE